MRSTIGLDLDGHIGNMDIFTGIDYNKRLETIMLYGGQADVRYDTREMREGSSKKT